MSKETATKTSVCPYCGEAAWVKLPQELLDLPYFSHHEESLFCRECSEGVYEYEFHPVPNDGNDTW